jgi:hypothetical protein
MTVVSKAEFAELMNVSRQRVSQWLSARQIDCEALVGEGRSARINVEVAKEQLSDRLSVSQHLGANGKALLNGGASPIDGDIKSARLRQLVLSNERASADAALRAGIYVKADDVRQQFGAVASRLMTSFESAFMPMANSIVAAKAQTPNEVLRALRAAWLEVRAKAAKAQGEEALAIPPMIKSDDASIQS